MNKEELLKDPRFAGIEPFENKIWLSSPTMHGDEQHWVDEAIRTNWVSTVGANINEVEKICAAKVGRKYAVALASGTAALHLVIRLAGERLYGPSANSLGAKRQMLHAGILGFRHPLSQEYMQFDSPLPEDFTEILEKLRRRQRG